MERRASAGSRGRAAQRRAGPAHARGGAARARARARPRAAAGAPAAGAAQWLCLAAVLTVTRCMCRKALLAALPGSLTSVCAWRPCRQTADPPPRTTQMQLEAPSSACQPCPGQRPSSCGRRPPGRPVRAQVYRSAAALLAGGPPARAPAPPLPRRRGRWGCARARGSPDAQTITALSEWVVEGVWPGIGASADWPAHADAHASFGFTLVKRAPG